MPKVARRQLKTRTDKRTRNPRAALLAIASVALPTHDSANRFEDGVPPGHGQTTVKSAHDKPLPPATTVPPTPDSAQWSHPAGAASLPAARPSSTPSAASQPQNCHRRDHRGLRPRLITHHPRPSPALRTDRTTLTGGPPRLGVQTRHTSTRTLINTSSDPGAGTQATATRRRRRHRTPPPAANTPLPSPPAAGNNPCPRVSSRSTPATNSQHSPTKINLTESPRPQPNNENSRPGRVSGPPGPSAVAGAAAAVRSTAVHPNGLEHGPVK